MNARPFGFGYRKLCIVDRSPKNYRSGIVEFSAIDERVRKLCAKAANAREEEVEEVLAELREALKEHARFVRQMAGQTLTRMKRELPSSSSRGAA
jgi:hypothetical protein